MQAAEDAARFQNALGLEHVNLVGKAHGQGRGGLVVVVLNTNTCDIILHGKVKMCIVSAADAPASVMQALARCNHRQVIVWEKASNSFKDLADCTLGRLTPQDLVSFYAFEEKLHRNVEGTMTLQGTWCELRFGEASVETCTYTHIRGTVVLSSAVEPVLAQLRRTLRAEASPLRDATTPARGLKPKGLTQTTAANELA